LLSQEGVTAPGGTATVNHRVKILHLNNENTWRGGERQTLLLAKALDGFGVETAIACRPQSPLEECARSESIRTAPISGNPLRGGLNLIHAARDFDLIHCHTGRGHSLAALTARWHRKPLVVSRRVDFCPKPTRFNRYKYSLAKRIVCVSKFIAAQLGNWGVPQDRLTIIHEAVPSFPPTTPRQIQELRAALGLPANKRVVGNIAALVGHKDHPTLLRAAREVIRQRSDVCFIVIGDGERRAELLRLRDELGLTESVRFAGFLPQAQQYLPAFDVFVLSSSMEGLGTSILDAFQAGVPVAATAAGGIPDSVRQGETGLLAPVGDAGALAAGIVKLLDEPVLAQQVSTRAREWVKVECSVSRMAERHQQVYAEVLVRA
jgi:L-malate glycosyltransferase